MAKYELMIRGACPPSCTASTTKEGNCHPTGKDIINGDARCRQLFPCDRAMILIGLGANLAMPDGTPPRRTLERALDRLRAGGVTVEALSRWYESAPVPRSDQPFYVNAVARVSTALCPAALLALLHRVEGQFGRVRGVPDAARVVDLDLLAYDDRVAPGTGGGPILPHPRMSGRAFVLLPLADVAPAWRHPVSGLAVAELIAALPPEQDVRPLPASRTPDR